MPAMFNQRVGPVTFNLFFALYVHQKNTRTGVTEHNKKIK